MKQVKPFLASQIATELNDAEQTMAIAATFTAEPVEKALRFWQQRLDKPANIEFAPYNQVFQQLLDPLSLINKNKKGINIILLRFEDWIRYDKKSSSEPKGKALSKQNISTIKRQEKIKENVLNFVRDLKYSAEQSTIPYLVCICPASPEVVEDAEQMAFENQMEELLLAKADGMGNVYMVTPSELEAAYPVESYYDPDGDELGHIPYTPAFFVSLGTMITRRMHVINSTPYKVIVLDCDQTLWKGVCGEDGPLGLDIDSNYKALQSFMVAQHDAGMLICLCSKNNEGDVAAVFEQRSEMPLKREHITSWRINWRRKSENIRSLADELQLGFDSFIFIDDNPVECAEIQAVYPEVLALQMPSETETIPKFLQHTWAFDHLKTTEEDKKRTMLYKQNIQREKYREAAPTFKEFLAGLSLNVQISEIKPTQLSRVAQLTQRTNQFNMTTIRRSENEIQTLCRAKSFDCLVAEVNDRFGDYGLVGVMLFETCSDCLKIDTFLLSCRVLGRGVEHQMLAKLGDIAQDRKIERIDVPYVPTERNQPALDFLDSVGGNFKQYVDEGWLFKLPAKFVSGLTFNPDLKQLHSSDGSSNDTASIHTALPITKTQETYNETGKTFPR